MCVGRQNQQLRETESLVTYTVGLLYASRVFYTTFELALKLTIHVI